jgi:hypothetical protein
VFRLWTGKETMCRIQLLVAVPFLVALGCDRPGDEIPSEPDPRAADAVRLADQRFDPAAFDALDPISPETVMELRRMIFVGTAEGMPHWGIRGLAVRDVDAVARYIETSILEQ